MKSQFDTNLMVKGLRAVLNQNIDLETYKKLLIQIINATPISDKELLNELITLIKRVKELIGRPIHTPQQPQIVTPQIVQNPPEPVFQLPSPPLSNPKNPKKTPKISPKGNCTLIDLTEKRELVEKIFYVYKGKKCRAYIDMNVSEPIKREWIYIAVDMDRLSVHAKHLKVRISDLIVQYKDTSLYPYMAFVKEYHKGIFEELCKFYPNKKRYLDSVKIVYGKRKTRWTGGTYDSQKNLITISPSILPECVYTIIYHELIHIFFLNHKGHFNHYEQQYKIDIDQHLPSNLPLLKCDGSHKFDFRTKIRAYTDQHPTMTVI